VQTVRSRDGTTITFDRRGHGPPVVLVGGALSDRGGAADLAAHLEDDLTVITYDRRGRGDSPEVAPYAVEHEVEDLAALIEAAGGTAFVFGHSSGAVLSLRAAEAGLPIPRLAVYEPPFIIDTSRPPLPDDYVPHLDALLAAGRRGDAVEYFLTVGVLLPPAAIEGARRSPGWPAMEALAHTIAYDGLVMGDTMGGSPDPLRRWASLAVPTLVVDGGASPGFMHNAAKALADVLPNATATTLEGQTHGAAPDVLTPVLVAFFTPPN
jgi:pimeloyl-ACP methyl ester carboxylesterase